MERFLKYLPIIIYVLLFAGLKLSERFLLTRPETTIRRDWGDWTVWFILIPLWFVLIGPFVEYFVFNHQPGIWEMAAGGLLFMSAGYFSIKGYFDLQHGFTQAIEIENTSLVVTGLYQTIRHPISLGNILFCIACPLFLAAGPSWIAALVCILGILFRVSVEESFLQDHIPDYKTYKKRTWAMIPYVY